MKLDFLTWLQETATSTGDVAGFSMPLFTRASLIVADDKDDDDDDHKKKKKHHKKKK